MGKVKFLTWNFYGGNNPQIGVCLKISHSQPSAFSAPYHKKDFSPIIIYLYSTGIVQPSLKHKCTCLDYYTVQYISNIHQTLE